jgi:hypothetical protein
LRSVCDPRPGARGTAAALSPLEDNRGHDRSTVEQIDAVWLAWSVAKPPVMHQRSRTASIEVDRVGDAELDQRVGELAKCCPS